MTESPRGFPSPIEKSRRLLVVCAATILSVANPVSDAVAADETQARECAPDLSNLSQEFDQRLKKVCGFLDSSQPESLSKGAPFVIRFTSDLQGLQVGAPVRIRGFRVGTVRDVAVTFDSGTSTFETPVQIDLLAERIVVDGKRPNDAPALRTAIDLMVKQGLRAHVKGGLAGFGQPHVALNISADVPPATLEELDGVPEIPEGRTSSERIEKLAESLLHRLEALPLENLTTDLSATMAAIRTTTEQLPESMERLVQRTESTMEAIESVVAGADIKAIIAELKASGEALRGALVSIEEEGAAVLGNFRDAAGAAGRAATQAGETAASLEKSVGPKSVLWRDIDNLLEEVTGTARALRLLVEYLERHPEALITGKSGGNR